MKRDLDECKVIVCVKILCVTFFLICNSASNAHIKQIDDCDGIGNPCKNVLCERDIFDECPSAKVNGWTKNYFGCGTYYHYQLPACPDQCESGLWDLSGTCHVLQNLGSPDVPGLCGGPSRQVGNPINLVNGNKYQHEIDFRFASSNGIALERYYNSLNTKVGVFGLGWSSDFFSSINLITLSRMPVDNPPSTYLVFRQVVTTEAGRQYEFEQVNSSWKPVVSSAVKLYQQADGWIFEDEGQNLFGFDGEGKLQYIKSAQGPTRSFTYNSVGQVESIASEFGQGVSFSYSNGFLATANVPGVGIYSYGYSGNLLKTVNFFSVAPGSIQAVRTYLYENLNFPNLLTGIVDESGLRYATWSYDSQGRAISSEHGDNAAEKVTLTYDSEGQTTVFNSFAKETVYSFVQLSGLSQITQVENKQSENCALANQYFTYYSDGTLQTKTDSKGNVTYFERDAFGRTILKVTGYRWQDGQPRSGEWISVEPVTNFLIGATELNGLIATKTCWHSTLNKVQRYIEPTRVTTFNFLSDGRLGTRKVESRNSLNDFCP